MVVLLATLLFTIASSAQETETTLAGFALQHRFIDALIENEVPVSISLTNFGEVDGKIIAHDETTVLLENVNLRFRQRLIFKSAIVGIVPAPIGMEVLSF
jgi:RNA chaperone Hfq